MKTRAIVFAALLSASAAAHAQDKLLNSEVSYFVQTAGGITAACGVDVRLVFLDNTYRQGSMEGLSASLSWSEARGNIGILLKVTGIDFDGLMQPHLFKVEHAFLAVKGTPAPLTSSFQCENTLNFCGAYWLPLSAFLYGMLSQGELAIGFNRQPGALDIVFPIKGSYTEVTDQAAFTAFHKCMLELTRRSSENAPR